MFSIYFRDYLNDTWERLPDTYNTQAQADFALEKFMKDDFIWINATEAVRTPLLRLIVRPAGQSQ